MIRFVRACALVLCLLASAGCGEQFGSVSGKVTLGGKPVAKATVSFFAPDGTVVSAITDDAGGYRVDKVPNGPAQVSVVLHEVDTTPPDVIKKRLADAKKAPPPPKHRLPERYADTASSGLSCEVVGVETTYDIPLTK